MKQLLLPVVALILFSSCNNESSKTTTTGDSTNASTGSTETKMDAAQATTEISALVDNIHKGFHEKDLSLIEKSMTNDALMIGTDPTEIWGFSQFKDSVNKYFADTSFHGFKYEVPTHKIEVHGNSAIIVDQYQLDEFSKKMMTRNLSHARYEKGKWLIDMYSWNFIPRNSDIGKINKAL